MPSTTTFLAVSAALGCALAREVPAAAQVVDQKVFNVLENVPPPTVADASSVCSCSYIEADKLTAIPDVHLAWCY
jgi:gluconolactonase